MKKNDPPVGNVEDNLTKPRWACPPGHGYRKLENGLLDMTWVPPSCSLKYRSDHAQCAILTPLLTSKRIKHNTRNSALLRLPAEIRNMIWKFALGGYIVNIDRVLEGGKRDPPKIRPMYPPNASNVDWKWSAIFKLPQVCRQVYAETATMVYQHNTFAGYLTEYRGGSWDFFVSCRLPAQIDAVVSIRPVRQAYGDLLYNSWRRRERLRVRGISSVPATLPEVQFPNLQEIYIDELWRTPQPTMQKYEYLNIKIIRTRNLSLHDHEHWYDPSDQNTKEWFAMLELRRIWTRDICRQIRAFVPAGMLRTSTEKQDRST